MKVKKTSVRKNSKERKNMVNGIKLGFNPS